jgi:uncharacterized protein YjbI with pentapeptide repeats
MEHKDELTPLESRLVVCAAAGDELDCAPTGATSAEFDQIDDWEERKIRAEVLIALCTGEVSDWSVHPRRGLRLRGAYIAGQVDLSRAQLTQCPLAFHTCRFEEGVVLYQATTSDISFTSCDLPLLHGNELNSGGSLDLRRTHLRKISLVRAEFRGLVGLSEVYLSNPKSRALNAERMSAAAVDLNNTHVEGEVRLLGANIGGQLNCREGTQLINPKGTALSADGLGASSVNLSDTHVEGGDEIRGCQHRCPAQLQWGHRADQPRWPRPPCRQLPSRGFAYLFSWGDFRWKRQPRLCPNWHARRQFSQLARYLRFGWFHLQLAEW